MSRRRKQLYDLFRECRSISDVPATHHFALGATAGIEPLGPVADLLAMQAVQSAAPKTVFVLLNAAATAAASDPWLEFVAAAVQLQHKS